MVIICILLLYNLIHTYVCRRRGHRSRYVHSKRPMVGYFTDSSSMSGVATDVSTNDASDEGSSDEGEHVYTSAVKLSDLLPNS